MNCTKSDENVRRDKTEHGRPRRWFGSLSHARPRREYVEGANGSFHIRASQAEIFSEWSDFPFKLNRYNGSPRGAGMSNIELSGCRPDRAAIRLNDRLCFYSIFMYLF